MTIHTWYLVGSTLLAVPFLIMTWALAWVNGKRHAQHVAVGITLCIVALVSGVMSYD